MNYAYGILLAHVNRALNRSGICPELAVLHADQRGKPTFAYDIMELFRQPFVDRAIISIAGKGKLIKCSDDGRLTDESRRQIILAISQSMSKAEEFLGQLISRSEIITRQVIDIQRCIRKTDFEFTPYRIKKW